MKRACEWYAWNDFKDLLEKVDMFNEDDPLAYSISLVEESPYTFSVNVENYKGEVKNFSMYDVIDRWYKVDELEEVREIHRDNYGIWIIYERGVDFMITFTSRNALGEIIEWKFKSKEDLKEAYDEGAGPVDDDQVWNVKINGKDVWVGNTEDNDVGDDVWFEDLLTYLGFEIW